MDARRANQKCLICHRSGKKKDEEKMKTCDCISEDFPEDTLAAMVAILKPLLDAKPWISVGEVQEVFRQAGQKPPRMWQIGRCFHHLKAGHGVAETPSPTKGQMPVPTKRRRE